jgi:hypothetical protein
MASAAQVFFAYSYHVQCPPPLFWHTLDALPDYPTKRSQRDLSLRIVNRLFIAIATAVLIAAATVDVAPLAAAGGSASAIIDDLKSKGYAVQINWVSGFNTEPLDVCQVTGVNIPGDTPASRTTAYVDVSCPNHPDDGGFGFGVGIG